MGNRASMSTAKSPIGVSLPPSVDAPANRGERDCWRWCRGVIFLPARSGDLSLYPSPAEKMNLAACYESFLVCCIGGARCQSSIYPTMT